MEINSAGDAARWLRRHGYGVELIEARRRHCEDEYNVFDSSDTRLASGLSTYRFMMWAKEVQSEFHVQLESEWEQQNGF